MKTYLVMTDNSKPYTIQGEWEEIRMRLPPPGTLTVTEINNHLIENCGSCLMYARGKCTRSLEIVHSEDHCQLWETK